VEKPKLIMKFLSGILFLFFAGQSVAQGLSTAELNRLTDKYARSSFPLFFELLSIPNDAHYPQDIEKNIKWCERAFNERKFRTVRLQTQTAPLLLATRITAKAKKTVLIYLQLDGQPVDAKLWQQESPWQPVLKEKDSAGNWKIIPTSLLQNENIDPEWRIFARSASDAKGPAAAFLAALDGLKESGYETDFNIKVIMDFEEELGSPHLAEAVQQNQALLAADMLIIFDGPRHISNQPTLSFGARGICEMTITTYGPRKPVHSGNYGNYTPNPAQHLAKLLASMKDDEGRVLIPGYYDGVSISKEDRKILAHVPDDESSMKKFLGIAKPDAVGNNFQEAMQYPTLNIRGLNSLYVGKEARTLIPDKAVAEIDIRLVPSSDPERLISLVEEHIRKQGFTILKNAPTEEERLKYPKIAVVNAYISYAAFQTPFSSAPGLWLTKAMRHAFGKDPILIKTAGGSIPIAPFIISLNVPAVAVDVVNADNNQHAENENIRVGNYIEAVKTFLAILSQPIEK
jgi:acetylornithine deacetylase/succinyl-diaminopimelate desuccinylase-like protein